jgi:hypothetical protein
MNYEETYRNFDEEYRNFDEEYKKLYAAAQTGMTLRDYFAAKAMLRTSVGSSYEQLAKNAYEIADAMMKAREA